MNIYDFAIQMEEDGEDLYNTLAKTEKREGFARIFELLATDEKKHSQILRDLNSKTNKDLKDTTVLKKAHNVFKDIDPKDYLNLETEVEIYKKAKEQEEKSTRFYLEKAKELSGDQQKILLRLAEEEKKHAYLLQNIIDFVTAPERWVEHAEFIHDEKFYGYEDD